MQDSREVSFRHPVERAGANLVLLTDETSLSLGLSRANTATLARRQLSDTGVAGYAKRTLFSPGRTESWTVFQNRC
jgi:hypothetical protein